MCELTKQEFEDLQEIVKRNDRALRGDDGNPGLVTKVELIQNDVKWIREAIESKLNIISQAIQKESKHNITWAWLADKLIAPAITAGAVAFIMWLITR